MSYILDALRRADSERERGRVPGLHAQPIGGSPDDDELPDGRGMRWGFVASLLGLALIVVFAWLAFGRDKPIEVIVSAPPAPVPAPVPVPAPAPAPPPVVAAEPNPAAVPEPAAPAPASHIASTAIDTPAERPQRKAAPATRREPTRATVAAADAPDEPKAVPVSELPDAVRRELPALAITGATYSESRTSRMLIVNGQLYHEGDLLAPNLHLEQIRLKSAVLRYKNYRYSVGY